jgi:DNA-binding NarL/FixJ family response regulator
MTAVLGEHRFVGETPDDLIEWVGRPGPRAVLLGVYSAADLDLVRQVHHASPTVPTVALLDSQRPSQYQAVLRAGATAAVARAADPEHVVMVLERAFDDDCLLPRAVAHAMATQRADDAGIRLSAEQVAWLQALADGRTVNEIARDAGYSTRQFHRLLRQMFDLMGVSNRHQAIQRATERKILDAGRGSRASGPSDNGRAQCGVARAGRTVR